MGLAVHVEGLAVHVGGLAVYVEGLAVYDALPTSTANNRRSPPPKASSAVFPSFAQMFPGLPRSKI